VSVFSCTRAVLVRVCQDGPGDRDRARALALLKQLRGIRPAPDPDHHDLALLRELVLAVRELAGPGWITARAASLEVTAFTALDRMPHPPPSAELDQILASVLQARFRTRPEGRRRRGPGLPAAVPARTMSGRQAPVPAEPLPLPARRLRAVWAERAGWRV
jgi:hypothetical protein